MTPLQGICHEFSVNQRGSFREWENPVGKAMAPIYENLHKAPCPLLAANLFNSKCNFCNRNA